MNKTSPKRQNRSSLCCCASNRRDFCQNQAGINKPAVRTGKEGIHSLLYFLFADNLSKFWWLKHNLKPNVKVEAMFTENSCFNRHLRCNWNKVFQQVSVALSLCKCAYMRGPGFWAPTQTISLFWKCSLKSSGADGSQEQRGKRAALHFCFPSGPPPPPLSFLDSVSWSPKQHLGAAGLCSN